MGATGSGFWQRARQHWPWPRTAHGQAAVTDRPVRWGGHTVVRPIAQGQQSNLLLATAPATGQRVALKVVDLGANDKALHERFRREAAAASRLNHEGLVHLNAWGMDDGPVGVQGWLAMAWVDAHDLSQHTSLEGRLRTGQVLTVAARVAEALDHAHRQSVVHRDLKPANVLVSDDLQTVKVADFGCALLKDLQRSRSGVLLGSPAYMAPEQLLGQAIDGRTDLYALGVIMFQLLTARLPFEAGSLGDLLSRITHQPAPSLLETRPELSPEVAAVIARCLAKSPASRPSNGTQLACELRQLALANVPPPDSGAGRYDPGSEAQCAITP